jgi:hypothetical protein
MRKYKIIIILLSLIGLRTEAQNFTVWNFKNPVTSKNKIGLGAMYNSTIYAGVGYARIVKLGKNSERAAAIQFEIASPVYLLDSRNKDFYFSGSTYLLNTPFDIKASLGTQLKMYEDVIATGNASFASFSLNPGYYRANFYIATEISWKSNISTSFNFNEVMYPGIPNTTLYHTTQNLNLGLNAGMCLHDKMEINLSGIYQISAVTFANYHPYTQNIGVSLSVNYSF